MNNRHNYFVAGSTFAVSFIVYLITLAPTVSLWDCGEFIASSVSLGVPHPPGAPFYLLVGRFFSMLPFSVDIAYRVNMLSALTSALSVMFLYLIIVQLIKVFYGPVDTFEKKLVVFSGGVIGALTFAFTETFWFNATEAEVYAVSMLLTAVPLYLVLKWMEIRKEEISIRLLIFSCYLFGLAVGVHLLNLLVIPALLLLIFFYDFTIFKYIVFWGFISLIIAAGAAFFSWPLNFFIIPAALVIIYMLNRELFSNGKFWAAAILMFVIGGSTYIAIYIRSNLGPFINENDPSTLTAFMKYWNREQYGQQSLFLTLFDREAPFWKYQFSKMYLRYFGWNFIGKGTTLGPDRFIVEIISTKGLYFLPFILGLIGAVIHFIKDWRRALAVFAMFIMTGIAVIVYLNQPDPQPRERDYVYVGSFFAFAIWIGVGFTGIIDYVKNSVTSSGAVRHAALGAVIGIGFVIGPLIEYKQNFDGSDRRGNYFAWDYSYNILQSCEENSILFTNGDNDTFPLWYLQVVEGVRTDITIINLSLLNTEWYIRQLKYGNPLYEPLPITLNDDQISTIQPRPWETQTVTIPVPAEVYNEYIQDVHPVFTMQEQQEATRISVSVDPTISARIGNTDYRGLRVQDYMVLHLIAVNQWERPVYFALTIPNSNKVNLMPHLRLEGMAYKLVPYDGSNLAADVLARNLLERFSYREFNNPDVYYNVQKLDLFQNLRTAYYIGIDFYWRNRFYDQARELLDAIFSYIPEEVAPIPNVQLAAQFARIYNDVGERNKGIEILQRLLERQDVSDDFKVDIAQLLALQFNDYDQAVG
ncbi:protein O-mannosyl-transferase family, partial [candidate division KSB1 bacterium]